MPRWLARAKAAPARIDAVHATHLDLARAVAELTDAVGRLGAEVDTIRAWVAEADVKQGWTAGELSLLRQLLGERADDIDGLVTASSAVLHRAIDGARRDASLEAVLADVGPPRPLRPGLTVFTISWNHAGFLPGAVESGLRVLEALDGVDGEVLVLDNGSSDESPAVIAELEAGYDQVRAFRAEHNLGLARGRSALLRAATTSHALLLDADNIAMPDGVAEVMAVAEEWGSILTYGNVFKVDADDVPTGVISNEPLSPAFFASNYIDNMNVIDVGRIRALGGWSTDPALEHVDDWALTHHVLRHGGLVGFVPTVVGRYRVLPGASNRTVPDRRIGDDRVDRTYNADGRLTMGRSAAFAAHPRLGCLWATPAAAAQRPELAVTRRPAAVPAASAGPDSTEGDRRLLVVGPGGVGNAGDDAIVLAVVRRLRSAHPDTRLDVLTDGPAPVGLGLLAPWVGPLTELVADGDASAVLAAGGYAGAHFAGGGSLTSQWREGLLEPRAALADALVAAGVPYTMSGQGVGPLDPGDHARLHDLVARAEAVAVRDPGSAELCAAAGVAADRLTVTGDDSLGLSAADPADTEAALTAAGLAGQPYLALALRSAPYVGADGERLEAWAAAADELASARGWAVLGVAVNDQPPEPEAAVLARLAHGGRRRRSPWRLLEAQRDPERLVGVLAGAEAAVSHSYHAALFALAHGRPAVLVAHREYGRAKAQGLARLTGLPDALVADDPAGPSLAERIDAVAASLAAGATLTATATAVDKWWATLPTHWRQ